ncbi:hypothetical protein MN608_07441 [Microdochium nivale]|nr:hypothetical protein MN608_07441 [Microdochium nivale]
MTSPWAVLAGTHTLVQTADDAEFPVPPHVQQVHGVVAAALTQPVTLHLFVESRYSRIA